MTASTVDLNAGAAAHANQALTAGTRLLRSNAQTLVSHYADMLSFEWRQRRRRAESALFDFAQLCRWDDRIQAYLNGFALLQTAGIEPAMDRLKDPITEGELFSLSALALAARERRLMQACIGLVQAMPHFGQAFHAALEWADWSAVEFALALWPSDDPQRQALVLRALANQDVEVDPAYVTDCAPRLSTSPVVQLSAMRCALSRGESGWALLAPDLVSAAPSDVRLAAAEAIIVFGNDQQRRDMLPVLRQLALGGHGRIELLATRALMTLGGTDADQLLEALTADSARARQHIAAVGWCGDIKQVPWLADRLDDPTHARAAGAALITLTGSCPLRDGWALDPAKSQTEADRDSDRMPVADPDADLPWPNPAAFASWWREQQKHHPMAGRTLAGRPRNVDHLLSILREGRLAVRPQAAWLLQVASGGRALAHLAPSPRQSAHIVQLTEATHRAG